MRERGGTRKRREEERRTRGERTEDRSASLSAADISSLLTGHVAIVRRYTDVADSLAACVVLRDSVRLTLIRLLLLLMAHEIEWCQNDTPTMHSCYWRHASEDKNCPYLHSFIPDYEFIQIASQSPFASVYL